MKYLPDNFLTQNFPPISISPTIWKKKRRNNSVMSYDIGWQVKSVICIWDHKMRCLKRVGGAQ